MKDKFSWILITIILSALVLSACGAQPAAPSVAATAAPAQAETAAVEAQPTATVESLPAAAPSASPAPTEDPQTTGVDAAEQAARDYFAAVSDGNIDSAGDMLSSFSLMVFQMTRGDAVSALQAQKIDGVSWSDLEVLDAAPFDEQTILVHVNYSAAQKEIAQATPAPTAEAAATQAAPTDKIDELWPIRLENGEWRYNWNNLIDFRSLGQPAQTVNGVTVLPTQINRYSDRIELSMLIQNRTSDTVVFGQTNEILGTFYFGDEQAVAENAQFVLNPLRSVPEASLVVKGLYASFPDKVEIRKWKSYNVDPWYTFQLD